MSRRTAWGLLLAVSVSMAGCAAQAVQPPSAPQAIAPGVAFAPAFGGREFAHPVELVALPDGAFLVADREGLVERLAAVDEGHASVFLDLSARVNTAGVEQGLLSVALDPDFEATGFLYVYYVRAGLDDTRLSRFTASGGRADPDSELVLLEIDQPGDEHNGGAVRFGPDGYLYLGLGDGERFGDPERHGQNLGTLFASILRIDVAGASAQQPYRVPADNPFVGRAEARPEIWAYGLRNPWRMAFDPLTGELWVGDVGQNRVEEVNRVRRGGNYGWSELEGDDCFRAVDCDPTFGEAPVVEYFHGPECAVTGGVVYRGSAVPALRGHYLYSDFCSGVVWALPVDPQVLEPAVIGELGGTVTSFAVDGAGEVYVLRFGAPIVRIAAAPAPAGRPAAGS